MQYGNAMPASSMPADSAHHPESRRFATGRQFELRRDNAVAVVTELAAGLRLYSRGGVQLTESYGDAEISPGATGITLAPWANRLKTESGTSTQEAAARHHGSFTQQRQPRTIAQHRICAGG